jgi:energy-coupling factor transport system ATP-binding protein
MEDIAKYAKKALVLNDSKVFCYDDVKAVFGRAEELSKMGLSVPQITAICMKLNKLGYPVPPDIYTVEEAQNHILRVLNGESGVISC